MFIHKNLGWGLIGFALTLVGQDADAASMRCGNRLVSEGDSTYEVRATCGDPDHHDSTIELRTVRHRVTSKCAEGTRCESWQERTVEVKVDRFIYDFGKNRFIQYLIFEQGRLVRVDSGRYGHKPAQR